MRAVLLLWIFILLLGSSSAPVVQAQQAAAVSGFVRDAQDEQPLPGAQVKLTAAGRPVPAGSAMADLEGRYRIEQVTPGPYVLTVRFQGYRPAQFQVTLAAGQVRTLDVSLSLEESTLSAVSAPPRPVPGSGVPSAAVQGPDQPLDQPLPTVRAPLEVQAGRAGAARDAAGVGDTGAYAARQLGPRKDRGVSPLSTWPLDTLAVTSPEAGSLQPLSPPEAMMKMLSQGGASGGEGAEPDQGGEAGVASAPARVPAAPRPGQVQIVQIYGRDQLEVGKLENFRVRIAPDASWPIEYQWDLGDGTWAEGNNIAHRYQRPGRYVVTITARNDRGMDVDTLYITVVRPRTARSNELADRGQREVQDHPPEKKEDEVPVRRTSDAALRSPLGIEWAQGGYTWAVATSFNRRSAVYLVQQYRDAGYRTDLFVDDRGSGSTAYRVVIGQFETEKEALAVRSRLLREVGNNILLIELSGTAKAN